VRGGLLLPIVVLCVLASCGRRPTTCSSSQPTGRGVDAKRPTGKAFWEDVDLSASELWRAPRPLPLNSLAHELESNSPAVRMRACYCIGFLGAESRPLLGALCAYRERVIRSGSLEDLYEAGYFYIDRERPMELDCCLTSSALLARVTTLPELTGLDLGVAWDPALGWDPMRYGEPEVPRGSVVGTQKAVELNSSGRDPRRHDIAEPWLLAWTLGRVAAGMSPR
jgi:hypothetical protein